MPVLQSHEASDTAPCNLGQCNRLWLQDKVVTAQAMWYSDNKDVKSRPLVWPDRMKLKMHGDDLRRQRLCSHESARLGVGRKAVQCCTKRKRIKRSSKKVKWIRDGRVEKMHAETR
jgi:hypothetical protein